MAHMHFVRKGSGTPLLLIHGLGGHWRSWARILDDLAAERDVIAIDLPGHGDTPPLGGPITIDALADAVTRFLERHELIGIDAVGSSMGARLVLELARRGVLGAVVSLAPGGFWEGWERRFFGVTLGASIRVLRILRRVLPWATGNPVGRTLLLSQFSTRPWRVAPQAALEELRSYVASPSFDELLHHLAYGPAQPGAPAGSTHRPLVIGWGRRDRVCLPVQASRAQARFPDAQLHWFDACGHFPHWDSPGQTVDLILSATRDTQRATGRACALDAIGT